MESKPTIAIEAQASLSAVAFDLADRVLTCKVVSPLVLVPQRPFNIPQYTATFDVELGSKPARTVGRAASKPAAAAKERVEAIVSLMSAVKELDQELATICK
jgi:hypothetical protein